MARLASLSLLFAVAAVFYCTSDTTGNIARNAVSLEETTDTNTTTTASIGAGLLEEDEAFLFPRGENSGYDLASSPSSNRNRNQTPPSYFDRFIQMRAWFLPKKALLLLMGDKYQSTPASAPPPKPMDPQPFGFESVFGDNMVLQHAGKPTSQTQAAVYGFLGPSCQGVQLDLILTNPDQSKSVTVFSTREALINATTQPFGEENGWGVRPCSKEDCPPYDMKAFNPWNTYLPTWKVLLPPQKAGGNFTVHVMCLIDDDDDDDDRTDEDSSLPGLSHDPPAPVVLTITNVTFGDMWYCSGQSNMWLPVANSFHRNSTANAIVNEGKYRNIRLMAGSSGQVPHGNKGSWAPGKYGAAGGTNPWMTAFQAIDQDNLQKSPLFQMGAACWYFGQGLVEEGVTDIPIGLANTAIGGQRIQEFMDNSTIGTCHNRTGTGHTDSEIHLYWEAQLFAQQVLPFVDLTVKGWVWYQGENNMHDIKGNAKENIGYSCEMKTLIEQWRAVWSKTKGTTDPEAPFGVVTLASSGDEGGPDMGAMRHAQTANYGVLPHEKDLPNTFLAQAYDLDDEWGPELGPCFENKCCEVNKNHYDPKVCTNTTLKALCNKRPGGCTAAMDTRSVMGGIHPRSKKYVGDRLAAAAYNLVYGGKEAYTGPTLQGCSMPDNQVLEIRFNKTLLRGDHLVEPVIPSPFIKPGRYKRPAGGSQLWVQTNASSFCMESSLIHDGAGTKKPHYFCPAWAGGNKEQARIPSDTRYDDGWIQLNFTLAPGTTNGIHVDLSPLPEGTVPTAVRYAWGLVDCCDYTDPTLFVTHGCVANCPIQASKSKLPANPFQARIVDGKCECVAPQICTDGN